MKSVVRRKCLQSLVRKIIFTNQQVLWCYCTFTRMIVTEVLWYKDYYQEETLIYWHGEDHPHESRSTGFCWGWRHQDSPLETQQWPNLEHILTSWTKLKWTYINMLLCSVENVGHSNALSKILSCQFFFHVIFILLTFCRPTVYDSLMSPSNEQCFARSPHWI